jgi:hypothetical protein
MKKFILAFVIAVSTNCFAQTADQQAIVFIVNAALVGRNAAIFPSLIAEDVVIYQNETVYDKPNSKQISIFLQSQSQYTNPKIRCVIDIDKAKLVNDEKTASMFCITRLYEEANNDPVKVWINSLFLKKINGVWKIHVWQQSSQKYSVGAEWE